MPLEFRCRVCGRLYVPDHADIVAGPAVYRRCPDCRPVDVIPPRPIQPAASEDLGAAA